MMRRHSRYALFLAGVAAYCLGGGRFDFEAILGEMPHWPVCAGKACSTTPLRMDHRHADPAQTAHARTGAAHRLSQDETLIPTGTNIFRRHAFRYHYIQRVLTNKE